MKSYEMGDEKRGAGGRKYEIPCMVYIRNEMKGWSVSYALIYPPTLLGRSK